MTSMVFCRSILNVFEANHYLFKVGKSLKQVDLLSLVKALF